MKRNRRTAFTCECGLGGGPVVARDDDFVVLVAGERAVHHLVQVGLCLAVIPLHLQCGGRPREHPQVLGRVDLWEKRQN